MSGVVDRFRSISRALSVSEDDSKDVSSTSSPSSGKSTGFSLLSKFGVTNSKEREPERKHKTLLVIDSKENDWVKLLKGRTLHGHTYDIRVEQATFSELSIVSSHEKGVTVSMRVMRNGTYVSRSFRPDFVLTRERIRGVEPKADAKHLLFGLMHGNIPALNSLEATYSFMEKPLMYAQLTKIQKQFGAEEFPLIDQTYYQSYSEMLLPPSMPVIVKVGSANSGFGKVCVASPRGFQDVASLVAVTDTYATSEPFLEARYDIRIQKIGNSYKVYKRRSLSDSWKANTGTSVVEELALTDRYKFWADECSKMFRGVDILCIEAIHTKKNTEHIMEVTDTGMTGSTDQVKSDMKLIADLVVKKMEAVFHPHLDREVNNTTTAALSGAMSIIGGAASPHKVDTGNLKRPATAEPTANTNSLMPNGAAPVRKATSQESLNPLTNETKQTDTKDGLDSQKSSRRSSFAVLMNKLQKERT